VGSKRVTRWRWGRAFRRGALWAAAAAAAGCAAHGPSASTSAEKPFPSRDEVRELGGKAAPVRPPQPVVRVDSWDLAGPFPDRVGEEPIAEPTAWDQLLVEAASRRAGLVVASESMRCAAREFGRFRLEHDGLPDLSLHRFLLARCGATGQLLQSAFLHGEIPADASEPAVLEQWRKQADELVQANLGTGARAVGIWFGRRANQALLMVVSAERRVRIDPLTSVPDPRGRVELRGEVLIPARGIEGQVNQGRFRVADCESDPSLKPPRFALSCPTVSSDESAWIDVVAYPPGRILGERVLEVLARPGGGAVASFRRPRYGRSASIGSDEDFSKRLLVELNRVREQASAPPLALEPRESEDAAKLASPYFGAYFGTSEPELGDVAALGLMAGWNVEGPIRDARVGGTLAVGTNDLGAWLAQALEQPSLRSTLLDPKRSRLAIGPLVSPENAFMAALVATYSVYGGEDPAAQLEAFHAHVDREFAAHGLPAPLRDEDAAALAARYVGFVQSGSRTPETALRDLLAEVGGRVHAQVHGWRLEGSSPESVELPDELLDKGVRRIAAAVGYYQPADSAWGRTLVFVVILPEASLRSAERAGALAPSG
jgi:hypothetical protein